MCIIVFFVLVWISGWWAGEFRPETVLVQMLGWIERSDVDYRQIVLMLMLPLSLLSDASTYRHRQARGPLNTLQTQALAALSAQWLLHSPLPQ